MPTYVIGDIHGHLIKLIDLLSDAKLIDQGRKWSGGTSRLWFMGDFFDRGPHGIGVVDLVMRLQTQAAEAGGEVRALLGNHEVLFLGAHHFPQARKIMMSWKRNGGQDTDMSLVTSRQIAWLRSLPALALVDNHLFMHADAMFYLNYGSSVEDVNETVSGLLRSNELNHWDQLLDDFSERMAFSSSQTNGTANVLECLEVFGGQQIVHGHTPIQYVADVLEPKAPFIYANNKCINVDGGIYLGAPGFIYRLPE